MASNRHLGRIVALQTLYEMDFRQSAGDESFDLGLVLKRNVSRYESTVDDVYFVEELVKGVAIRQEELDTMLRPLAPEWPLEQVARMDRVVLRMGLYELYFEPEVPAKVVINESVELAKAFGGDNSSKFINGVLGTALKNKQGIQGDDDASADSSVVVSATMQDDDQSESSDVGATDKTGNSDDVDELSDVSTVVADVDTIVTTTPKSKTEKPETTPKLKAIPNTKRAPKLAKSSNASNKED